MLMFIYEWSSLLSLEPTMTVPVPVPVCILLLFTLIIFIIYLFYYYYLLLMSTEFPDVPWATLSTNAGGMELGGVELPTLPLL